MEPGLRFLRPMGIPKERNTYEQAQAYSDCFTLIGA
jgi:hypothetical protein